VPLEEPDRRRRLEAGHLHVLPGVDVQRLLRRRERVEQGEAALARDVLVIPLQVELDRDGDPPRGLDQRRRPEQAEGRGPDQRFLGDGLSEPGDRQGW